MDECELNDVYSDKSNKGVLEYWQQVLLHAVAFGGQDQAGFVLL